MSPPADVAILAEMKGELGEIRGQLRELIHTGNNTSQKVDALAREVSEARGLPGVVADLSARLALLEADKNRREGASGMVAMILRSPALGWLVGAAITAWAILTGRVHL